MRLRAVAIFMLGSASLSAVGLRAHLAVAQDAPVSEGVKRAAAASAFDEGSRLFKARDYDAAASQFELANRTLPSAAALGNAIRARRAAKQSARAATLAVRASATYPDNDALAELARQVLAVADKQLHRAAIACNPGCVLTVDGRTLTEEPVQAFVLYVEPGAHALVANWSKNRSRSVAIEATKGGGEALSFEAPAEPQTNSVVRTEQAEHRALSHEILVAPVASKPISRWVALTGVGVTAALGVATVWSGIDTQRNPGPDVVRVQCAGQPPSCPAYQDGLSREHRTNVLLGAAVGMGAITGITAFFFTDWRILPKSHSAGRQMPLVPFLQTDKGVSLGVNGLF